MGTRTAPPVAPRRNYVPRTWVHDRSTFKLAEGGASFGQSLKKQAIRIVRILTDDAEISLGLLLRDDEALQIRVAHCTGYVKDEFQMGNRQKWVIEAVSRSRIKEMVTLS